MVVNGSNGGESRWTLASGIVLCERVLPAFRPGATKRNVVVLLTYLLVGFTLGGHLVGS
jgi:hypothetical protein